MSLNPQRNKTTKKCGLCGLATFPPHTYSNCPEKDKHSKLFASLSAKALSRKRPNRPQTAIERVEPPPRMFTQLSPPPPPAVVIRPLTTFPSSPIAPFLISSLEPLPFPEMSLVPTPEFDIDTFVPTQELNTTAQLVTLDSVKQMMAHFESRFASLQAELREQQQKTAEHEHRVAEHEHRVAEHERRAVEQERRAAEQERRAAEQELKIEELIGSSRSHEQDLRNLKQAIIYQCYAWQIGLVVTPADLSIIGYSEVDLNSIHSFHLGDICLFLSDHPETKSNQVNTIWLIMERMLQNHDTESLTLKHNQKVISLPTSEARNHLLSTTLPDRKALLALRLRLVRRQILTDFSAFRASQQHRVSLTATQSETLTRLESLVRNMPFAIPETIPGSGIGKSFFTMLLLEKFSTDHDNEDIASSSSSPPLSPCYRLSEKSVGVFVYLFLCLTVDDCSLKPSSIINFERWRTFMNIFNHLIRDLQTTPLPAPLLDSQRIQNHNN